jgi:hypothetical protein
VTGAHEVHGDIRAKWQELGSERSVVGYPTTDETPTGDSLGGRFNHFQHGSIYWTPGTGAHEVHGPIRDVWSAAGWQFGPGYPTTDVVTVADFANVDVCWFTRGIIASPQRPGEAFIVDPSVGALLVVAPNNDFVAAAEPFIRHKRQTGIPTFLHTLTHDESDGSENAPYRLKGRITEAYVWLGVRWVLLLGDASLIPTRHRCTTAVPRGHLTRSWFTATDFYYADLFARGVAVVMGLGSTPQWTTPDSWDSNGDSLLNEHHWQDDAHSYNPDNVQAIPWIAVGRVPAHTPDQAAAYLAKVIAYECNEPSGSTALSILTDHQYYSDNGRLFLAATLLDRANLLHNTADNIGLDWPQGEPTPENLRVGGRWATRMAAASSRVLVYIGHGATSVWAVNSDTYGQVDGGNVSTFRNGSNFPIVMAAGCQTAPIMPDAPEQGRYLGVDGLSHNYHLSWPFPPPFAPPILIPTVTDSDASPPQPPATAPIDPVRPSPFDFAASSSPGFGGSWLFNPSGGGIAYFGEVEVAPDLPGVELLGRVLRHMRRGAILGDAWIQGQSDYRNDFASSEDRQAAPRIYLTYMHLFGDPSLRLW